jgi:hypothetical protein
MAVKFRNWDKLFMIAANAPVDALRWLNTVGRRAHVNTVSISSNVILNECHAI